MRINIKSVLLVFLVFIGSAFSQYQISCGVVSSGGIITSNTNFIFNNTIGESFVGKFSNTINQQNVGFWYVYQLSTITSVETEETIKPTAFNLEQNYPNPFNPSTTIKFTVREKSNVLINVYDILGSEIITLVNEEMDAGWYQRSFNASKLSSGVYLFRMEAGNYVNTKKMILLR